VSSPSIELISHPAEQNAAEKPLTEHLLNVASGCRQRIESMQLDLTVISQADLARLSFLIGLFHDFGKATSYFQDYIRDPRNHGDAFTRHSFVSAAVVYEVVKGELESELPAIAAFRIVKRHHANLEAFDSDNSRLKWDIDIARRQLQNIKQHYRRQLEDFYAPHLQTAGLPWDCRFPSLTDELDEWEDIAGDELGEPGESWAKRIEWFFVVNLLFSLLVDHDKLDAARLDSAFYNGNLQEPFPDVFDYIEYLRLQQPEKFDPASPINARRQEFLDAVSNHPAIQANQHFYTITAPTGIGKTFGCLAFARALMDKLDIPSARLIYCLPYTSIIDQNFAAFEDIMRFHHGDAFEKRPGRYLSKHHYLEPKRVNNRVEPETYKYKDYLDDVLLVESWQSAMVVTTFVQFFHSLVGHRNRLLKKFHRIVNSIVILDEIQNISPHYYKLLRQVLDVLGRHFNTYFLLITATQPEIFAPSPTPPAELAASLNAMEDPLFNRVKLEVDIAPQPLTEFLERFVQEFDRDNCLLIFNTRKSALAAYNFIKRSFPASQKVFCLTTNLVPADRKRYIRSIGAFLKQGEPIIVVSTQLVEAGVDLSFQCVYRDFGPLDSIVQAAGRCNRHGELGPLGGLMRLVRLQNEDHNLKEFHSYIYESKIGELVKAALTSGHYEARQFAALSADYFQRFDFEMESNRLLRGIQDLNYDRDTGNQTPVSKFRLIEEYNDTQIYILTTPEAQGDMDRLLYLRARLQDDEPTPEERDRYMLEIENLKVKLREFCLSLRSEEDLQEYEAKNLIQESGYIRYISYQNQNEYAYDPQTGFLKTPKRRISNTVLF
jgi:CRISPR-associated endonuclease/helicase Cas3